MDSPRLPACSREGGAVRKKGEVPTGRPGKKEIKSYRYADKVPNLRSQAQCQCP